MSARRVLFVNPRSGGNGSPDVSELESVAGDAGVKLHILREHDDLEELARTVPADVLGMAGGDGSLGAVAAAAIERDLPFVAVPWGTRNHFAGDAGLDTANPLSVVAAFDGFERRVDVGRANGRIFLNNVSLGVYARLVHRRERRRQRGETFARVRAIATSLVRDRRRRERFVVDGMPVRASVVLVANNEYSLDLFALGERERLDEGTLAVYAARGVRRLRWTERKATEVRIESQKPATRAAIDGEPVLLELPLELAVDPGALRLLVPRPAAT